MKLSAVTLAIVISTIFVCPNFGQQHDLSFWSRNTSLSAFPWYFYGNKKVLVDARYNFDEEKTVGVCVGKPISKENLTFIPEACGYFGKMNGYGPEIMISTKKGIFESFSQNQYVHATKGDSFFYHWTDTQWKIKRRFSLGIGGQAYKEISSESSGQIDIGPSAKFVISKNTYFKVWQVWSIGPQNSGEPKTFLGVGFIW